MSIFTTMFWTAPTSNAFWGGSSSPFWQTSAWTQSAIGSGTTGSFSSASGTYTVAGTGSGVVGTTDSLYFVNQLIENNFEIFAEVTAQTGTSAYAIAGLMLSDSASPGSSNQCALIGVSPQNGVNFTYRTADGQSATTDLGPSLTTPIWLRLTVSQSTVTGYSSSDGISWQMIGQTTMSLPSAVYIGFAVSSNISGTQNTATYTNLNILVSVPQRIISILPTWNQVSIGGASGSFVVNSDGSYTVSGNGTGVNPSTSSDVLYFIWQQTSGNVLLTAEVTALTDSNAGAFGGLMVSDLSPTYPTKSQCAVGGVTVSDGMNFQARPADNGPLNTQPTPVPSGSAPVWLQLQVSLGQVTVSQSTNGTTWTSIGGANMTLPSTFFMGFAVWSQASTSDPDTINSVTFKNISAIQNANMICWLRPDSALVYSGSNVSSWNDQSTVGLNASQANSSNQPSLVSSAVNGLAAVSFNGTSDFLQFPTISSAFSLGLTLFILINTTSITAGEQIISLGTATGNDYALGVQLNSSSQLEYYVYDSTGSVLTYVAYPVTMPTGTQLIEVVQSGASATLFLNGLNPLTNNSMNSIPSPSAGRTNSYLGRAIGGGSYFSGEILEVLLYQRAVTSLERQNIEAYYINKYAL